MRINRWVLIIGSIVVIIIFMVVIIFIYSNQQESENQEDTIDSQEVSDSLSTEETSEEATNQAIYDEDNKVKSQSDYNEEMQPVDYVYGSLPIITKDYTIDSEDNDYFSITINAYEGTEEATRIQNEVKQWFANQDANINDIDIVYIYKSE